MQLKAITLMAALLGSIQASPGLKGARNEMAGRAVYEDIGRMLFGMPRSCLLRRKGLT
jgi:hypothetical protein